MPDSAIFSLKTDNKLLKAGLAGAETLFKAFGQKAKETLQTTVGAFMDRLPLFGADVRTGLSAGLDALHDYEKGFSRLQAMLKATRNISGKTIDDLSAQARKIRDMSTFGVEAVQNAQSALLLFQNVRGGVFDDALETATDWATAMGEDVTAAADRLGRALNNPIEGLKALRNEGFLFTHQQELMIEGMVASGNIIGAQRMLLDRLRGTFGDAAKNELTTFSGMVQKTNNMLRDMWRAISNALVPIFEKLLPLIQKSSEESERWAIWLRTLTERAVEFAEDSWPAVQSWINNVMEGAKRLASTVIDRVLEMSTFVQTSVQEWPKFFEAAKAKIMLHWEVLRLDILSVWDDVSTKMGNVWSDLVDSMIVKFAELKNAIIDSLDDSLFAEVLKVLSPAAAAGLSAVGSAKTDIEGLKFAQQMQKLRREQEQEGGAFSPSDEDLARLEELRKKAEEAGAVFGSKFDENLAKNREKFDEMLAQVADALNLNIATGPGKGKKGPDGSKENPFIVQDPNIGKGGAFEDLVSLQKRIQSAAFKTPEVFAIDAQTAMMGKNHKEQMQKLNEIKENTGDTADETEKNTKAVKESGAAPVFP